MAFVGAGGQLELVGLPFWALLLIVESAIAAALLSLPRHAGTRMRMPRSGWDLPARMVIATALVLALTSAAPALGARLAGLLATFPVFAAVLAVFAHRVDGRQAA